MEEQAEHHQKWWQKIKQHPYATGMIVLFMIVLLVIILFIFLAYRFGWDWTGFNSGASQITITNTSKGNYTATISQPSKSLWDWLGLLAALAIPAVVGLGAAWFTAQQGKVSARENTDNQRETALQTYIDKMSELLLTKLLDERTADGELNPEYERVRKIARIRTLTLLPRLDGKRKARVLQFLHESELIKKGKSIIDLSGADLRGADLCEASLRGADLRGADLRGADLRLAHLDGADLRAADLQKALLNAANLQKAELDETEFGGADLSLADLLEADLGLIRMGGYTVKVPPSFLESSDPLFMKYKQPKSLKGAIMPDGSTHP